MVRATITPWRTSQDLLEVRQQLYSFAPSPDHNADAQRRRAVARVMAWKQRGNLPHAVESTALLVDALQHAAQGHNSAFSVRAVYSAAFARFVTGFCDIGRHKERSLEPISMLEMARQIDMPANFVALRHEATHEELPSLQRLTQATASALQWLWTVYWSRLEEPRAAAAPSAVPVTQLRAEFKQILRTFRTARKEALRNGRQTSAVQQQGILDTARLLLSLCKSEDRLMETLVDVLVTERLLWSSKPKQGVSMKGAYMIWDQLLQAMVSEHRRFLAVLVRGLVEALTVLDNGQPGEDDSKAALCNWLLHIVGEKSWPLASDSEKQALRRQMLRWACIHPSSWISDLGVRILEFEKGGELKAEWQDLLSASMINSDEEEGESGNETDTGAMPSSIGRQAARQADAMALDEDAHALGSVSSRKAQAPGSASADGADLDALDLLMSRLERGQTSRPWVRAAVQANVPIGVVR